jgi:transcriptional regulator with XRE-family HTH domain
MTDETLRRPSQVFASRLRELRKARGYSQADLAKLMRDAGRPMSKPALLRIENGERGLSLDEAVAFAYLLNAAPAHMLSPPEGDAVMLTDNAGVDGEGLRAWLRTGDPFGDFQAELRGDLERLVTTHARALVDAQRGGDTAGTKAALFELGKTALRYQEALMDLERRGFAESSASPEQVDG